MNTTPQSRPKRQPSRKQQRKSSRRHTQSGITIIIILGLLAITLGLSYSMTRSQIVSHQIQTNLSRRGDARQAALSGIAAGLQMINSPDWAGVGTSFKKQIDSNQGFHVAFASGDPKLTSKRADYSKLPYRVTITSTGAAADPLNTNNYSTHKVQAVVELVRRKMSTQPENWEELQKYTIYQWSNHDAKIQFPVRTEGPILLQGPLELCPDAPAYAPAREIYLIHLESMRNKGYGDHRPFSGPIYLPKSQNAEDTLTLIDDWMHVAVTHIPSNNKEPIAFSSPSATYQLYSGGEEYTIPIIDHIYGGTLSNITLEPDPITNPLGVFISHGNLTLGDNVTIKGLLLTAKRGPDIHFVGTNINIQAVNLPTVYGDGRTYQLPVLLAGDHVRVQDTSRSKVTGMAFIWHDFEVRAGDPNVSLEFKGRMITHTFKTRVRSTWKFTNEYWKTLLAEFLANLLSNPEPIKHFPRWLQDRHQLHYQPLLTFKPDSSGVTYHWHNWNEPFYQPHPNDGALRWDLVRWIDNP